MNDLGYSVETGPIVMYFLTRRMGDKDISEIQRMIPRRDFVDKWKHLEHGAHELAKKLTGKEAGTPSGSWKILTKAVPENILFLSLTTRQQAVDQKLKNFFGKWRQVKEKLPFPEMAEMRITPQLPEYQKILDEAFLLLLDGKLRSHTEIMNFLKPYEPPPPPPPPPVKRGRGKAAAAAATAVPACRSGSSGQARAQAKGWSGAGADTGCRFRLCPFRRRSLRLVGKKAAAPVPAAEPKKAGAGPVAKAPKKAPAKTAKKQAKPPAKKAVLRSPQRKSLRRRKLQSKKAPAKKAAGKKPQAKKAAGEEDPREEIGEAALAFAIRARMVWTRGVCLSAVDCVERHAR